MNKEITLDLAPIQPNVNGIYYDEDSWKSAMSEYMKTQKPTVKFGYNHQQEGFAPIVGYIKNIDFENKQATIVYTHDIDFMDEGTFRLGFTLMAEEIKGSDKPTYHIGEIRSANILIWQL